MTLKAIVETLDDVDEPFRELYTENDGKFELTGVEGLPTHSLVKSLREENARHRVKKNEAEEKLSLYTKITDDPSELATKFDRIKELELAAEGKGLDEEKINQLLESRLATKLGPIQRDLETVTRERDEFKSQNETLSTTANQRHIKDEIDKALSKSKGFRPDAREDAHMFGLQAFQILEDGSVVTKENVQGIAAGISATDWLSEMQARKEYWWGETTGGGGRGGRGGNLGNNPWTKDNWNVTEQNKIYKENQAHAEKLAGLAGTKIGGTRPAK